MNNLLEFRKRMTQKEAHDYVSERHRIEDIDHKSWWKSVAIFWAIVFGIVTLAAVVKYATACDLGETDGTIKQIRVDGV